MRLADQRRRCAITTAMATCLVLLILRDAAKAAETGARVERPAVPQAASGSGKTYEIHNTAELTSLPVLEGGDVVVLMPGTYADVTVTFESSAATADLPVHVYGKPLGGAVFKGITRIVLKGDCITLGGLRFEEGGPGHLEGAVKFENGSRQCRLTNCSFRDFNQGKSDCNWVFLRGYAHRVDHCLFEKKKSLNATLAIKPNDNPRLEEGADTERRHRIDHNYFGPRDLVKDNGYECIRIGDSSKQTFRMGCIVENNYFYQTIKAEHAGEMEVVSNKCRGNVYRYNVFEDCDGQLTLRHGRDCLVEGNWFLGTGGTRQSGVRIIGMGHTIRGNYFDNVDGGGLRSALCIMDGKYGDDKSNIYEGVENVTIEGNLFKNCLHPVNMGESKGPTDPPRGITFLNNHIVSNEGSPLFTIESDVQFSKIDGNRVYSSTGNYGPLPPGTTVDDNLTIDPGLKPVDAESCKPVFCGGPPGTYRLPGKR